MYDVIVVGAGPAGLSAGIYTRRFGLKTLILNSSTQSSQVSLAAEIENYLGFKKISGIELMKKFLDHAKSILGEIVYEDVVSIELKNDIKEVTTEKNNRYEAKAIIIATGTQQKTAGIKGEEEFIGKGVSYCATCDGPLFKGKKVVVIGGGDSALTEALYLKSIGCNVSIVHRRNEFRAAHIYVERAVKEGIKFVVPHTVREIFGKEKVEGIILDDGSKIDCEGVFVLTGSVPTVDIAKKIGVETDENNFIVVNKYRMTNVPGIFAAGDVTNTVLRQVATAVSDGAISALGAYKFIKGEEL